LLAQVGGEWDLARDCVTEAYVGFGELGTPVHQGLALAGLARCDEAAGDPTTAGERYDDLLDLGRRVGEPGLTSTALEGLCRLASERGDPVLASTLLAEAAQLRTSSARPAPPHERRDLAAVIGDLAPYAVPNI